VLIPFNGFYVNKSAALTKEYFIGILCEVRKNYVNPLFGGN